MNFSCAFKTDIGLKRQQNQDNGGVFPELGLFLVADGMGGHNGGEIASAMVLDLVPSYIEKEKKKGKSFDAKKALAKSIEEANRAIYERAKKEDEYQGMGTTTTALLFDHDCLFVGQVGDSRCYFLQPDSVWQITRDHSLVEEKLHAGLITREQMKTDQMRNVITRSVGFEEKVNVDIYEMSVQSGDLFMICSDGLSGPVNEKTILEIVKKDFFEGKNIETAVRNLIDSANEFGGDDNITVALTQVLGN